MNENKLIGIILVRSKSKRLPEKCFLSFGKINSYLFNSKLFRQFVFRKLKENPYYLVKMGSR